MLFNNWRDFFQWSGLKLWRNVTQASPTETQLLHHRTQSLAASRRSTIRFHCGKSYKLRFCLFNSNRAGFNLLQKSYLSTKSSELFKEFETKREFSATNKLEISILAKNTVDIVKKRTKKFEKNLLNQIGLDTFLRFLKKLKLNDLHDTIAASDLKFNQLIALSDNLRPKDKGSKQEIFDLAIEFLRNMAFHINHQMSTTSIFESSTDKENKTDSDQKTNNSNNESEQLPESEVNKPFTSKKIMMTAKPLHTIKCIADYRSLINRINSENAYAIHCIGHCSDTKGDGANMSQICLKFLNQPNIPAINESLKCFNKSNEDNSALIAINKAIEITEDMNIDKLYIFSRNKSVLKMIHDRSCDYEKKHLGKAQLSEIKYSKNNKFQNIIRSISISLLYKDIHLVHTGQNIENLSEDFKE
ncbi:MAG: hypothetical protein MHMPM18_001525 [Marteilia pararefringens]